MTCWAGTTFLCSSRAENCVRATWLKPNGPEHAWSIRGQSKSQFGARHQPQCGLHAHLFGSCLTICASRASWRISMIVDDLHVSIRSLGRRTRPGWPDHGDPNTPRVILAKFNGGTAKRKHQRPPLLPLPPSRTFRNQRNNQLSAQWPSAHRSGSSAPSSPGRHVWQVMLLGLSVTRSSSLALRPRGRASNRLGVVVAGRLRASSEDSGTRENRGGRWDRYDYKILLKAAHSCRYRLVESVWWVSIYF